MDISTLFRLATFFGAVFLSTAIHAQELVKDQNGFVIGITL